MDEMEFTEAESNMNDLVSEYQQYQEASSPSSCSTSPPGSPTRTSPTGTETWSESARTSPSFSPGTRSTSRTEKSRPSPSCFTERRTFSIMTSQPSQITTLRSHSCGWPGS